MVHQDRSDIALGRRNEGAFEVIELFFADLDDVERQGDLAHWHGSLSVTQLSKDRCCQPLRIGPAAVFDLHPVERELHCSLLSPSLEKRLHHVVEYLSFPRVEARRLAKHPLQVRIGVRGIDVLADEVGDRHAKMVGQPLHECH